MVEIGSIATLLAACGSAVACAGMALSHRSITARRLKHDAEEWRMESARLYRAVQEQWEARFVEAQAKVDAALQEAEALWEKTKRADQRTRMRERREEERAEIQRDPEAERALAEAAIHEQQRQRIFNAVGR